MENRASRPLSRTETTYRPASTEVGDHSGTLAVDCFCLIFFFLLAFDIAVYIKSGVGHCAVEKEWVRFLKTREIKYGGRHGKQRRQNWNSKDINTLRNSKNVKVKVAGSGNKPGPGNQQL